MSRASGACVHCRVRTYNTDRRRANDKSSEFPREAFLEAPLSLPTDLQSFGASDHCALTPLGVGEGGQAQKQVIDVGNNGGGFHM